MIFVILPTFFYMFGYDQLLYKMSYCKAVDVFVTEKDTFPIVVSMYCVTVMRTRSRSSR